MLGVWIGIHFGATEAIDRLLGIAHHEQSAGTDTERAPAFRIGRRWIAADPPDDFHLQWISVLSLVDENAGITRCQSAPDGVVARQQIPRLDETRSEEHTSELQ